MSYTIEVFLNETHDLPVELIMLIIDHVQKSLGGKTILKDLSLQVAQGERVALLGLSGSGKTTILKTVCGLILPDQGKLSFNGQPITPETLRGIRQQIGYVVQDGGLFPHLTLFENLALVGREAGLSPDAIEAKARELSGLTQLSFTLLQRFPRQVSGGQRQRVGLMRALFLNPNYLLLDEPLGALDPITRRELQVELKDLFIKLNKTVLLVTHDLFEAKHLADRIILLNEGSIAQEGRMEDLIERPASDFVRRFVQAQVES
jgi:osmoprotectant transport system ATP-binding protein